MPSYEPCKQASSAIEITRRLLNVTTCYLDFAVVVVVVVVVVVAATVVVVVLHFLTKLI